MLLVIARKSPSQSCFQAAASTYNARFLSNLTNYVPSPALTSLWALSHIAEYCRMWSSFHQTLQKQFSSDAFLLSFTGDDTFESIPLRQFNRNWNVVDVLFIGSIMAVRLSVLVGRHSNFISFFIKASFKTKFLEKHQKKKTDVWAASSDSVSSLQTAQLFFWAWAAFVFCKRIVKLSKFSLSRSYILNSK